MVYITGAVFSHTEGYNTLANLVGPLIFHVACMFLGGFCFVTSKEERAAAAAERKTMPTV